MSTIYETNNSRRTKSHTSYDDALVYAQSQREPTEIHEITNGQALLLTTYRPPRLD